MHTETALLEELEGFLRIPSISADEAHVLDVRAAAEWVRDFLAQAGAECILRDTDTGFPLVDARLAASSEPAAAPTVLVYGHVDVQPAGDLSLWESDPFVPEIRDGYLYGRGAVDDKGNLYLLLRALADLALSGELPVNLRVLCDGEEEIGGNSVAELLEDDDIRADACVVFDSMMPRLDLPSFEIGTRGLAYFRVSVKTGERDLHSGLFGGAALNASHVLLEMLQAVTALPDELRAGVVPPAASELESWAELGTDASMLDDDGGRPRPDVAPERLYEAIVAHPAVDV
ncbi:MAG: M20/M25/M40 family metallo-hydrolase, partial [Gaiellaceae bacterium]